MTSGSPGKGPAKIQVGLWQGGLESMMTGTGRCWPLPASRAPSLSLPPGALSWALGDKPEHPVCSFALQGFVEIAFCRRRPGTGRVLCRNNGCIFLGNQHRVTRQLWAGKASLGQRPARG